MTTDQLLTRLSSIKDTINTKEHPMQEAATIKMAMSDLIDIIKEVIESKNNTNL